MENDERDCVSYPGYSVTRDGRVITHRHRYGHGGRTGGTKVVIEPSYRKEVSTRIYLNGSVFYRYASISINGKSKPIPVHVLIADAFIGRRPNGLEVRHLNGDSLDNDPLNLCYGTHLQNGSDMKRHGRTLNGTKHPSAKLREAVIPEIRKEHSSGESIASLARHFDVSETTIRDVIKGRTWTHV